jgi:SAM-dependent methyltransferase
MTSEPPPPAEPEPFGREEGRSVFGRVAASYDAARPGYPDRIYEILRDRCGLGPASRVLEIGPGTGQATRRLLELADRVVAVEPSDLLADLLRSRFTTDGFEVVLGPFEEVHLPPSSFDLAVSATAFHWLDPDLSLPKIAAALRPGGWIALWWNEFGDPAEADPFDDATERVLGNLPSGPSGGSGDARYALDVDARTRDLARHGFGEVEHEAIRWTLELDPARTRQLYASFSNVARLPDAERDAILDEIQRIAAADFGGRVERRMVTAIYTAHT